MTTAIAAVLDLVPNFLPFLSPAKYSTATRTGLFVKIEFLVHHETVSPQLR